MSRMDDNEIVVGFGNDVDKPLQFGASGAIVLLPTVGNTIFNVTCTILHFIQMKGFFGGKVVEYANQYLRNSVEVVSTLEDEELQPKIY